MGRLEEHRHLARRLDLRHRGNVARNRVGVQPSRHGRACACDHGGRIDAARQKNADGHVGHQMRRHAVADRLARLRAQLVLGYRRMVFIDRGEVRERARLGPSTLAPAYPCARPKAFDAAQPRQRRWDEVPRQEREHACRGYFAVDERCASQRGDLRRERDAAGARRDVQRLDAEAIACHRQRSFEAVPHRQREHPARAAERRNAVADNQGQQHFRVGGGNKADAGALEIGAQLAIVVNLAVVHDAVAAVGRRHRLVAARRGIDDGETPVHEQQSAIREDAFAVGTTVRQRRAEISSRTGSVERAGLGPAEHATNAAHGFY